MLGIVYLTPILKDTNLRNVIARSHEIADETGAKILATNPVEAVSGANVIYTDVFVSWVKKVFG